MTVSQTQIVSSEIVVDAATYAPTRSYNTDVRGADWVIHSAFLLSVRRMVDFPERGGPSISRIACRDVSSVRQ